MSESRHIYVETYSVTVRWILWRYGDSFAFWRVNFKTENRRIMTCRYAIFSPRVWMKIACNNCNCPSAWAENIIYSRSLPATSWKFQTAYCVSETRRLKLEVVLLFMADLMEPNSVAVWEWCLYNRHSKRHTSSLTFAVTNSMTIGRFVGTRFWKKDA